MKLSIIIPAYNEEKTINKIIEKVKRVNLSKIKKEIVIIDDFSRDGTRRLLESIEDKAIKVYYHEKNKGKGVAIRTGLKNVTGDIIIIQDADLEYNPNNYPELIKPILKGKTDVVYGTRLKKIKKHMYLFHYLGNWLLTLTTNILYNTKITDMETGYKVFRADVIKGINLKAKRFDFEPEITAKVCKKGYKIVEVPINFKARSFKEGKKITWIDGIKALGYLIKYKFVD